MTSFPCTAISDDWLLPDHLQRELNLTRWRGGRIQDSRVRDGPPRGVEQIQVVQRRKEIGMVERVKEFSPPLGAECFGDSLNRKVLSHRQVRVHRSRSR